MSFRDKSGILLLSFEDVYDGPEVPTNTTKIVPKSLSKRDDMGGFHPIECWRIIDRGPNHPQGRYTVASKAREESEWDLEREHGGSILPAEYFASDLAWDQVWLLKDMDKIHCE